MASITDIPIEIITSIIDNLAPTVIDEDGFGIGNTFAGSLEDLKACALVCRDFLPLCQKHIFKTIELPTNDTTNLDDEVVGNVGPHTSIARFAEIVVTSPAIGGYVRNLICWLADDYEAADTDTVSSAFQSLTKLETIAVHGPEDTYWVDLPAFLTSEVSRLFRLPTIRAVALYDVQVFDLRIMASCIRLDTLYLVDSTLDQGRSDDQLIPTPSEPIHLRRLVIGGFLHVVLPDLMSARLSDGTSVFNFDSFKALKMDFVTRDAVYAASDFLQKLGHPLEAMNFSFFREIAREGILTLSLNDRMRAVKNLELYFSCDSIDDNYPSEVCKLLQNLSSNHPLQILKISSRYLPGPGDLTDVGNTPDWVRLNDTLLAPGWSSLNKVEIQITSLTTQYFITEGRYRATVLKYLPMTSLKGLSTSQSFEFVWNFKTIVQDDNGSRYIADF